jgi:biotin synthase-related radical SAM superfamily protein
VKFPVPAPANVAMRGLELFLQVGWKIANIQPVREPSKEIPAYRRNGPMSKVKITIDQNAITHTIWRIEQNKQRTGFEGYDTG